MEEDGPSFGIWIVYAFEFIPRYLGVSGIDETNAASISQSIDLVKFIVLDLQSGSL